MAKAADPSSSTGSSGIPVDPECMSTWKNMQKNHRHRYIVFKIDEDRITVEKAEDPEDKENKDLKHETKFLEHLSKIPDSPRFAVFEIPGSSKIAYMFWSPDAANIKSKTIYASSESGFLRTLDITVRKIHATDLLDADNHIKNLANDEAKNRNR